ncbi:MAG: ATP-dependent zinc metalloprotease FtsH [Saprospiraceae bacterium]|nr:ATP-dependent zinc metalloprotease FtsH [Saprospiraceae bacterium]
MAEKEPNEQETPPAGSGFKGNFLWIYLAFAILLYMLYLRGASGGMEEISQNHFESEIMPTRAVDKIVVVNRERVLVYIAEEARGLKLFEKIDQNNAGPHFFFNIGSVEAFENSLKTAAEKLDMPPLEIKYKTEVNWLQSILSWTLPFLLLIGLWLFIMRRAGGGAGGGFNPFDFGKSRATVMEGANRVLVTFDDVAGIEEAKVEIREIVDFLKNPERYTRLGAKIPKGVILIGPPGTGKTLLARAVAGEAQAPFFSISGSEFVEMFVGVGASRVRDLFKRAKERAPSIIFIDEIDAIGRARGGAVSMRTNDERESTLNQLLTEMDGFGVNSGVIVMAATNRADVLDRALLRPGRFDRQIYLELPNQAERRAIFTVHLRPLHLSDDVNIDTLASQTPGFSGADIANICNEAALIAARYEKASVEMADFYSAVDRIVAGLEKKTKIISAREKRVIAVHEAGHATASWFLPHADSLLKVSIVPRGKALGAAWYLPEEHTIYTTQQFLDRICATLGGRAAEEIFFNEISSGALDDLEKVTKLAYTMVAYYGLNDKIGNISFYDSTGQYEQALQKPYGEQTAQIIDEEVRLLVETSYQRTKALLNQHRDKLETLADLLLQKEVVMREDLEGIFGMRGRA